MVVCESKGGYSMEKNLKENQRNELVKVALRCGRNMLSAYNYDNEDCGSYEDSTSNQTEATCC